MATHKSFGEMWKGMTTEYRGCPQKPPHWQEWLCKYKPAMFVWRTRKGRSAQASMLSKLFGKGQHKNSWRDLRVWKDKANKGEAKEETKSQAEGDNPAQHRYEECLQSINSPSRPTDRVLAVMRWSSAWTSVWMARQGCTSAVWHKTRWGGWEDSKAPSAGQVMWGRDRYCERHWWGGLGARTRLVLALLSVSFWQPSVTKQRNKIMF